MVQEFMIKTPSKDAVEVFAKRIGNKLVQMAMGGADIKQIERLYFDADKMIYARRSASPQVGEKDENGNRIPLTAYMERNKPVCEQGQKTLSTFYKEALGIWEKNELAKINEQSEKNIKDIEEKFTEDYAALLRQYKKI